MRVMLSAACAALGLLTAAAPAAAQTYWDGYNYYERHYDHGWRDRSYYDDDDRYDPDWRDRDGRYDRYGRWDDDDRWDDHWDRDHHWRGASWSRHVRACLNRYRTYNPRTDRYLLRPGVWVRCRL